MEKERAEDGERKAESDTKRKRGNEQEEGDFIQRLG